MARYAYTPDKPKRPRKPNLKQGQKVYHDKMVKAKNVAAVLSAAQKVSDETGLDLKDIKLESSYYQVQLSWYSPETDQEFARRVKQAETDYKYELECYEENLAQYNEWKEDQERKRISEIGSAVASHEAAVNTIAEVLKKYPDVLDKAVAKAVKGK